MHVQYMYTVQCVHVQYMYMYMYTCVSMHVQCTCTCTVRGGEELGEGGKLYTGANNACCLTHDRAC